MNKRNFKFGPKIHPVTRNSNRRVNANPTASASADSLVETVVEGIIEKVRLRQYVPGQRLVASDLAADFEVSRAPVREALHVLAGEGVVELIPNRGAVIRHLTTEELLDFLEFTASICVLGVERAAKRIDNEENRTAIDAAFGEIEDAAARRNPDSFITSLYHYHNIVNSIAGNTFLEFFYSRPYFTFYNRLLADLIPGDHWDEYLSSYQDVNAALLSGDPATAGAMFKTHMNWVGSILAEAATDQPGKTRRAAP